MTRPLGRRDRGTRPPAVAGSFYPRDADELRRAVSAAFLDAVEPHADARVPKAIVVPHAGFVYSGAVAASAYRRVAPAREVIERVVLLGPAHRRHVRGLAAPGVERFSTPLGTVAIDTAARDAARAVGSVIVDDEAHAEEHSLEVQLPFLQTVVGEFVVLPLAVGDASTAEVAAVLDACWGGDETLIVISTDLSHYHRYDEAVQLDARTAAAIVAGRHEAIADRDACGARPVRGLLAVAGARGLEVEQLDLRNSGDTAGDPARVVGYGAFSVG